MRKILLLSIVTLALILPTISAYEFCSDGQVGENLRIVSFDDMLKNNAKEWAWGLGEDVEVETRVQNRGDSSGTYALELIALDEDDNEIELVDGEETLKQEFDLSSEERKSIPFAFTPNENLDAGKYNLYLKFYKKGNEDDQCTQNSDITAEIQKIDFCSDGSVDKDKLEVSKIVDERVVNDNRWEWSPGDKIGISFKLENKDYPETTFKSELIMLDENNEEVNFATNSEDSIKTTTIDEDQDDDVGFYFQLDPSIEEGTYTIYVKSYDEDDDTICTTEKAESNSNPKSITIERPKRKIILSDVSGPQVANQSDMIKYEVKISNLGSKDEDKVAVRMYEKSLGIKKTQEIDDFKSGDTQTLTFTAMIPDNASLEMYRIAFSAGYEYDQKLDYYKSRTQDTEGIRAYLTVMEKQAEPEPIFNETTENETSNQTFQNLTSPDSAITGNVVKNSGNETGKGILVLLIALLGAGGIALVIIKKPDLSKIKLPKLNLRKSPKIHKTSEPNIVRTYKARL